MTNSSIPLDSNRSPNGKRRRIFGIRVRYWQVWLFNAATFAGTLLILVDRKNLWSGGYFFGYGLSFDLLIAGLAATAIVVWVAYVEKKLLVRLGIDADQAYDQNIFRAEQSRTIAIKSNPANVLRQVEDALVEYGAVIVGHNDATGSIAAVTSPSWLSAGEHIEVAVHGGDSSEVVIHAKSRFMPPWFSDRGLCWEHVQALATRIATGTFPATHAHNDLGKTGFMDTAKALPIVCVVGAWQRVLFFCAVFSSMFLSLLQAKNFSMVASAFAIGASLELFAYFKSRSHIRNNLRTESQEVFEVLLNNLWPGLWIFAFVFDLAQGWAQTQNVFAVTMLGAMLLIAINSLRNKKHDRAQRVAMQASRDQAELERQLAEAKLVALSAQIEPHFLFNTLASIQYLIRNDSGKASEMTSDLIRYLRLALPRMKQATARLADELELVRAYLGIMQIRMGARLQFAIDSPDELADVQIPTMTLITLVENAIKHGLEQKPDGGVISLMARKGIYGSGTLRLTVADTGGGFSTAVTGTGIGLANIRERLNNLYSGNASLELEANQPSGVKAILILPMERI